LKIALVTEGKLATLTSPPRLLCTLRTVIRQSIRWSNESPDCNPFASAVESPIAVRNVQRPGKRTGYVKQAISIRSASCILSQRISNITWHSQRENGHRPLSLHQHARTRRRRCNRTAFLPKIPRFGRQVIAITQVARRLAAQTCKPEAAEEKIVQQLDASESVSAPDQEPSQHADDYTDGGDGCVRLLDAVTMEISICWAWHGLYEPLLTLRSR
jgi:hypothetical protein